MHHPVANEIPRWWNSKFRFIESTIVSLDKICALYPAKVYRRRGDLPWRGDVIIPARKPAIIAGRNLKVSPLVRVVTPHANPPTRQPRFTRPRCISSLTANLIQFYHSWFPRTRATLTFGPQFPLLRNNVTSFSGFDVFPPSFQMFWEY